MSAYRKFSDMRQSEALAPAPPKPAKAPNVWVPIGPTLGALGTLDGAYSQLRNSVPWDSPADRVSALWHEAEEGRVAVVKDDGNNPRGWTESFARLDPNRPPGDVPAPRWQRFIDDVGLFLDSRFCAVAAAFGWGPHDLFGCDRDQPFARIDQAGLLWLLNGDKLVMLAENAAAIETRTGARHTYRLKRAEPGRVLAWELN